MSKISLRDWTKDPLNRIKLMEDILFEFQTEVNRHRPSWQFCCPTIKALFIRNKDYNHIIKCNVLGSYKQSPGVEPYVYLSNILPELVPYKDREYGLETVWFKSYATRCKALESAIQDIKLNKQYSNL